MNFRTFNSGNAGQYIGLAVAYSVVLLAVIFSTGYRWQYLLVASLMLLFPLLDKKWRRPEENFNTVVRVAFAVTVIVAMVILILKPDLYEFALMTLLFAAIPEEWFFRAYVMKRAVMQRAGFGIRANLISSLLFSLLHAASWGWQAGLLVFVPSLIFGLIYQKTRSLLLVIAIHAVSNLVYVAYLSFVIG